MEDSEKKEPAGLTRREALKISGLALGGLALGGLTAGGAMVGSGTAETTDSCGCPTNVKWTGAGASNKYTYFSKLPRFHPVDSTTATTIKKLGRDEIRITFMGSSIPLDLRRAQQMMSVFVEVGWDEARQMPLDNFVFDCGSGVCANYSAMNVGLGRMNKVFLNHLHGDHMSDLTHIYCFGPSGDRKSPLYVFGPKRSDFVWYSPDYDPENPDPSQVHGPYNDGTADYCKGIRQASRWHTESFSFQSTSYPDYPTPAEIQAAWGLPVEPVPVVDENSPDSDASNDAYAIIPIELDWTQTGYNEDGTTNDLNVAYKNELTRVKITHFPVIHTRRSSMGYKLEYWPKREDLWDQDKPHLTMIYTSDTKPETNAKNQAVNGGKGVDVFIHEMIVPAQVWAMNGSGVLPDPDSPAVQTVQTVQNSSHSPQGGFGYLLSLIEPRPRLTVATHFPVSDDTVACAMKSVQQHCKVYRGTTGPKDAARITWSFDLMVITVNKDEIIEQKGFVTDFTWAPRPNLPDLTANPPKYWKWGTDSEGNPAKVSDPYAQIDTSTAIVACDNGKCNYREDGY